MFRCETWTSSHHSQPQLSFIRNRLTRCLQQGLFPQCCAFCSHCSLQIAPLLLSVSPYLPDFPAPLSPPWLSARGNLSPFSWTVGVFDVQPLINIFASDWWPNFKVRVSSCQPYLMLLHGCGSCLLHLLSPQPLTQWTLAEQGNQTQLSEPSN